MPKAYSSDLRQRVLHACNDGKLSRAEIAAQFRVGEQTIYDWLRARKNEQRTSAKPYGGGRRPGIPAPGEALLLAWIEADNDLTVAELTQRYNQQATGSVATVSDSSVWRALKRLGLTHKKRHFEPLNKTGSTS